MNALLIPRTQNEKRIVIIIAILCTSVCITRNAHQQYASLLKEQTVCEIIGDPSQTIGKTVQIGGTFLDEPHNMVLFDESCSRGTILLRSR